MISLKEVEHVALLGRLELTEEEKKLYSKQLSDILEHARKLQDLDTANVPPTSHVLPLQNVFREDRPGEHMATEKVLANAPDRQDDYFKVPRIL
ncbi:MAG TPA: Asp-tRNA(Asn)/Glu-tRNA(Gln) amidotransferase subunit GatC [Desulfotomaculum sp.]|nr:MAG: glutamyl-tRNA amidotransferase [Peptococcaceae bacterium BRH_c8a]KJS74603.1 MAG: glutamyl-tRNA amidotransferase [Desulfotomaculum sp. BICA1-6]HBX24282.1 Asp-tRNA(Asn)/Glu-tRNA(Gln) amidotransferase subunit GatC [Desulfotomaculum sp.]